MSETLHNKLPDIFKQDTISLLPLCINEVPNRARQTFERIGSEITAQSVALWALAHTNGDTSYISRVPGAINDESVCEEDTLIVDTDGHNLVTGFGEMRYFERFIGMPGLIKRPYVGYTRTIGPKKQGLGTRRLFVLDAYARQTYGQPLYSGTHMEPEAISLWDNESDFQKLVTINLGT